MTSLWSRIADLPVTVERLDHAPQSMNVGSGFTRHTTIVQIHGHGAVGRGEDVTYEGDDQLAFQASQPRTELVGDHTLASLSARLDELDLWEHAPPSRDVSRDYRRWAFESAALDLALRQNGTSLPAALDRAPGPLSFVVSMGLGSPPSLEPLEKRLALFPDMRFKIDANAGWSDDFCDSLAALDRIAVVDLKGYYEGTPVDLEPDPELYLRVTERVPSAWIEDARLTPAILEVLEPHRSRLTFDAPIHRVADVEALPFRPDCLNIKPSRSGRLRDLFELYEYCESNGIAMYAGGQFELDVGRRQCQVLAALFHANADNDISPTAFHSPEVTPDLPVSPLAPTSTELGFDY